ncbi:MAG: TolC family protein [Verrucomicrobiota bacterium JB022]|nr:TolC family protein [Verrucomicrobiota bacterium JB022]
MNWSTFIRGLWPLAFLPLLNGAEAPRTLLNYLETAQRDNPGLEAFSARYEAAQARIPQARSLPDPMLQVTHFVESVETRNGPQENAIMLNQRLPWFGKLDARGNAASAEAEALWYAYQNQQLALARRVAMGFYEYAYTAKALELTRSNVDLLDQLLPMVEERVRGGGDLNPVLRLQVELGKLNDRLQTLEQQRAAQSAQLRELLGMEPGEPLIWPEWSAPATEALDGPSLQLALEANHPELQMLARRVESAEARREIARLENFPDITLGLNYIQIGDPGMPMAGSDPGKDAWGVMVSVNLPVWRGKYDGQRDEAHQQQRAAEAELRDRENGLKAELAAALARYRDADRRLTLYRDTLLPLAGQAAEISRTSYEVGRATLLELIDSERSKLELQLLYWRAAADAAQQRVVLQTLTNQPLAQTFQPTLNREN